MGADPLGEGAVFGGCSGIQKHWQSSLQQSLSRSLQKGSFNVMQQMGSFSMPGKRNSYSESFRAQAM